MVTFLLIYWLPSILPFSLSSFLPSFLPPFLPSFLPSFLTYLLTSFLPGLLTFILILASLIINQIFEYNSALASQTKTTINQIWRLSYLRLWSKGNIQIGAYRKLSNFEFSTIHLLYICIKYSTATGASQNIFEKVKKINLFRTTRLLPVQKLSFFQVLLPLRYKTTCCCLHVSTTCSFQDIFGDTGVPMVLKSNKSCLGNNGI